MKPNEFIIKGRFKKTAGTVTIPLAAGHRIILNPCSNDGVWSDDNKVISKRWGKVHTDYTRWHRSQNKFELGETQEVNVQSDTAIFNMLIQDDDGNIDYNAASMCLDKIGELAVTNGSSVHTNIRDENVLKLLTDLIIKRGINVTVYEEV